MSTYAGKFSYGSGDLPIGATLYGTCETAAATAAKVAALSSFDYLMTGVTVHIKFTYSNTAENPTLKVGGTDAKSIKLYGTTAPGTDSKTSWNAGSIVSFTYDGTYWVMDGWLNDDTIIAVDDTLTEAGEAADAKAVGDELSSVRSTLSSKYEKPAGGVPDTDIASASVWNAKGDYSKPSGGIPDSDIASASTWNSKAAKPDMATVTLSATWSGDGPYTQTVTVTGATVTANSKVDLQPNADHIAQLIEDGVQALYIANNNGTLTAYAVGAETSTAITVQCIVTEVLT